MPSSPDDRDRSTQNESGDPSALQSILAECIGTFVFAFAVVGAADAQMGGRSPIAPTLASALSVIALIYALGGVSGAHFNPAVTLGFAVRGVFDWRKVPVYWCAQSAGAVGAAALFRGLFGLADEAVTQPGVAAFDAFAMEFVLTSFLVVVVLGTASRYRLLGPNAALAVGATLLFCGLVGERVSGASMNPARSLGPAVALGEIHALWIYLTAPFLGALFGAVLARALKGGAGREASKAASGEP